MPIDEQKVRPVVAPYIGVGGGGGSVGGISSNVNVLESCRVASSTALGLTYVQNVPVGKDMFTGAPVHFSGVTLAKNDRILVKDEVAKERNGIYFYTPASNVFQRSDDWDRNAGTEVPIPKNTTIVISDGDNAGTEWSLLQEVDTVGVSPANFTESGASLVYTGSQGVLVSGNTITLINPVPPIFGGTGLSSIGTSGQVLLVANGVPSWGNITAGQGINVANGSTISLAVPIAPEFGGTGLTTLGTEGQVLTISGGVPAWTTITGGSDISTVGTITSGTWNGTPIAPAFGGTGLSAVGTNGQVLTVVSGAPAWADNLKAGVGINILGSTIVVDSTVVRTNTTPTLNGLIANGNIISQVATPVQPTDAANKGYVDSLLVTGSLHYNGPCAVATTANLAGYTGGVPAATSDRIAGAPSSIDGITLSNGDRILVKSQTLSLQNGIYTYNAGATAFDRAVDWDRTVVGGIPAHTSSFVKTGTINGKSTFVLDNSVVTVGTDSATFTISGVSTSYLPGTGINIVGTTISLNMTGVDINGAIFNNYAFSAVPGTPPVNQYLQTSAGGLIKFDNLKLDGASFNGTYTFSASASSFLNNNVLTLNANNQAVFAPLPPVIEQVTPTSVNVFENKTIFANQNLVNLDGTYFGTGTNNRYAVANSSFTPGNTLKVIDGAGNIGFSAGAVNSVASGIATTGVPVAINPSPPPGYGYVLMSTGNGTAAWKSMFQTGFYVPQVQRLIAGVGPGGSITCHTASWCRVADNVRVSGIIDIVPGDLGQSAGNSIDHFSISFSLEPPVLQAGFGNGGFILPNMAHGIGTLTSFAPGTSINQSQPRGQTNPSPVRIYVDDGSLNPQVRFDTCTDGGGAGSQTQTYYLYYTYMYVLYTVDGTTTQAISPAGNVISSPWGASTQPPFLTNTTGYTSTSVAFAGDISGNLANYTPQNVDLGFPTISQIQVNNGSVHSDVLNGNISEAVSPASVFTEVVPGGVTPGGLVRQLTTAIPLTTSPVPVF